MIVHYRRIAAALAVVFLMSAPQVTAQDLQPTEGFNKGGRTAFQFLKIGVGGRQAALGEAGAAAVRDVNSVFWNPANIAGIERLEAGFSYTNWFAGLDHVAGAFGFRWDRVGIFAVSIASLDYGDLQEAVLGGGPGDARTGESFTGGDFLAGVAYSREFTDRLAIGIGAKYIRETLFDYAVGTWVFDVGTSYDLGYRGIRLAMSVQNFGGSVTWLEDASDRSESGYDLPLLFRIGATTTLVGGGDAFVDMGPDHRLVLAAEAVNSNDYSERLNFGAEYWFNEFLALRGGYKVNSDDSGWTLGAGLSPSVSGVELRLDYAFVPHPFLNAPHRFTMTLGF